MANSKQIEWYGDLINQGQDKEGESLILNFSPSKIPLKQRWRNNGLSADFLADYVSTFFLSENEEDKQNSRFSTVKEAVGFIANELLENAMKYADQKLNRPTSISLNLGEDDITFIERNTISEEDKSELLKFIQRLECSDPNELYFEILEQGGIREGGSGLGLLSMINDYGARLSWQFETLEGGGELVSTYVYLKV